MNKKHRNIVIAALVILVLGSAAGVFAKYRTEQVRQAEMIAADFHFSADYLEEGKTLLGGAETSYTVSGWTDGITLELYNYEKENTALVSALDVTYTVTVSSDQFEVIDNGTGALASGEARRATVTVRPKADAAVTVDNITVTVETSPYNEGLTAKFVLVGEQAPEVTVVNNGTHYTATVYANHHSGTVTLTWAEGLVPDAANDIVQGWTGGSFAVEPFHSYEIIFFNPSNISAHGITLK